MIVRYLKKGDNIATESIGYIASPLLLAAFIARDMRFPKLLVMFSNIAFISDTVLDSLTLLVCLQHYAAAAQCILPLETNKRVSLPLPAFRHAFGFRIGTFICRFEGRLKRTGP